MSKWQYSLPKISKMYFHTSIDIEQWGYVTDDFSGYNRPSGKWLMLSPPNPASHTPNTPITPNSPNAPSLPNAPTAESVYGSHAEHLNYGYDGYEESQYPQQQQHY